MIEQGWEFRLDGEGVEYERLSNRDYKITIHYDNMDFFYSTKPTKIKMLVNSVEMTKNTTRGDDYELIFSVIMVNIEYIKEDSLSVIVNDLFDLEDSDNIKLLFYFDVDKREGLINNLIK